MSHLNDGNCQKCREIINKFPGFNQDLLNWFILMQGKFNNFHVSCAGRGEADQEHCFDTHVSDAHYGQSAHNYNLAMDTWFQIDGRYSLDEDLYAQIEPEIPDFIEWFGKKDAVFYERPHFEIKNWKDLVQTGTVKLVE